MPTVAPPKRTKKIIRELIEQKRRELKTLTLKLRDTTKRGAQEKDQEIISKLRQTIGLNGDNSR